MARANKERLAQLLSEVQNREDNARYVAALEYAPSPCVHCTTVLARNRPAAVWGWVHGARWAGIAQLRGLRVSFPRSGQSLGTHSVGSTVGAVSIETKK